MPEFLSQELFGATTTASATAAPVGYRPAATVYQANLKRMRASFTLFATVATTDTLLVGFLPAGSTFAFGVITASATMGTSTLAIGTTGTTGKYRAAAVFTAVDTPTMFGPATQVGAAAPALSAEEKVFITIATASLPTSGTLVVDIYYSQPN